MADVKWISIVTDIFDDEKILLIESMPDADSVIVIWFKLLCLAGKQNNSGVFLLNERIPFTDEMLATIFRRPLNTVRMALKVFEQYGMVRIINDTITIPNWDKHQRLGKLSAIKASTRERVAQYRERQKTLVDGCNKSNVTVTPHITLHNSTLDNSTKVTGRFTPPSLTEVQAYCTEQGYGVNAQKFIDFYESKGWMVGKNKMKNWQAAVRNWESRDKPATPAPIDYTKGLEEWGGIVGGNNA